MKKRTAKNVDQVRVWIETMGHHIGEVEEKEVDGKLVKTHMVLRGHLGQLRIPIAIWDECFVKPSEGHMFDNRMFRWDNEAEFWNAGFRPGFLNRISSARQVTATTVTQVRVWIETTPHERISSEVKSDFNGYPDGISHAVIHAINGQKLRVPGELWRKCFLCAAESMENRVYAWNYTDEFKKVWA